MFNKAKILLIEDHLGERLNIMKVLAQLGFEIETAVTFNRARDLIQKREYDLVISEYLLNHCPELQGNGAEFWTFAQRLQPNMPLFLIAKDSVGLNSALLKIKEEPNSPSLLPRIISKPVLPDQLQTMIERQLEGVKKLAG